ncbi:ethanolamine ammonia-lyase subunit EutC [Caballeronia sp. LP006]|uniref:ethanolamine ammonia-lyase subunit EutC n=1 Tax=Caballeronia sp. LP006 TaxID=3038552 RepID=UPI0028602B4E|nr:ethanolamine ammonia-lyase subunit EutC [Caballeronia sp. LP006]MDR5828790.1 ethanolamine ammonia-lyase subunit EutC [Caballeronia sp. LP006]
MDEIDKRSVDASAREDRVDERADASVQRRDMAGLHTGTPKHEGDSVRASASASGSSSTNGIETNPWDALKRFTNARIALGRTGDSLPTAPLLAFGLAHAQARDAVHQPLDTAALAAELHAAGFDTLEAASAAPDRDHYLRRPDLGRALDDASRARLAEHAARTEAAPDIVFVAADGLSAFAAQRHAAAFLARMRPKLDGWKVAPVVIATQARVALGDPIGELLGGRIVVVMIGERPGLSSPDSLGLYVTFAPRPGRHDAERNCISNVRPEGLNYDAAAFKLHWLLNEARRLKLTGVGLKDHSGALPSAAGDASSLDHHA